jgi:branched-chain amino acid transport system substrate-binding protein
MSDNVNIMRTTRRRVLQGTGGVIGALAFEAGLSRVFAQSRPIRIGVLNTFTKTVATFGEATWRGINLYLEETGQRLGGRPVEIIREDDEFNPQVGLQKLRKLVESDKVDIVLGPLGSHIAAAMVNYMKASGIPWMVTGAGSTPLTKNRLPNMFRTSLTNWQVASPMGEWLPKNGIKQTVILASDFLAGHDIAASFKASFIKGGGQIGDEIFVPVGTNDFSAYLTNIRSRSPQSVYVFLAGSEAGRFVNQFRQFGLRGRVKLTGFQSALDPDVFPLQGESAIGGLSSSIYAELLDTPENKLFIESYRKKFGGQPGLFTETGYSTMLMIDQALSKIDGKLEDRDAFSTAFKATKIIAPRGPVSYDQITHQAIHNIYIREVVQQNMQLSNKVIATVPDVGDHPDNRT